MKAQEKGQSAIKRKLMSICLISVLIAVQVANVNGKATLAGNGEDTVYNSSPLQKKIEAFKETGVGKHVNTALYDIEGVIAFAESLIGTPHKMGGYSSTGIDCSGLVKLAHEQFGVELPHSSHDQARYGTILSPHEELKRGDLVFFHSTYKKAHLITHAGIYIGDNKFIHASAKRGVVVSSLKDSGYYTEHFLFATRLAETDTVN